MIITGTGRSGTTFLVQLLTLLDFDTGFTEKDFKTLIHPVSLGGLEHDIRRAGPKPYIIKNPWICDYIDEVLDKVTIDHVFIPMRSLYLVSQSRRNNSKKGIIEGGMWDCSTFNSGVQENILSKKFYYLLLKLSKTSIPITFIDFEKMFFDPRYLRSKLNPIFEQCKHNSGYDDYLNVYDLLVNKDLIDVK